MCRRRRSSTKLPKSSGPRIRSPGGQQSGAGRPSVWRLDQVRTVRQDTRITFTGEPELQIHRQLPNRNRWRLRVRSKRLGSLQKEPSVHNFARPLAELHCSDFDQPLPRPFRRHDIQRSTAARQSAVRHGTAGDHRACAAVTDSASRQLVLDRRHFDTRILADRTGLARGDLDRGGLHLVVGDQDRLAVS